MICLRANEYYLGVVRAADAGEALRKFWALKPSINGIPATSIEVWHCDPRFWLWHGRAGFNVPAEPEPSALVGA